MSEFATENAARSALCETARSLDGLGINHGKSGNLSVRWHRGAAEGFLVTPSALRYDRTGLDDIVWVSLAQGRVDGVRRPSSEWRMHRDLYVRRGDVAAVVHTHASYCSSLSCLPAIQRGGIPAFHYMVAVAGGVDIRCADYATFGSQALSDAAIAALRERHACLLANHGMIAVESTLEAALAMAVEVEALARMYWQALQLATPVILPDEEMARVLAHFEDYRSDR